MIFNFFEEQVKVNLPLNYNGMKKAISETYSLDPIDVDELVIYSIVDDRRVSINDAKAFADLAKVFAISKKDFEVFIEISEKSKLYQKEAEKSVFQPENLNDSIKQEKDRLLNEIREKERMLREMIDKENEEKEKLKRRLEEQDRLEKEEKERLEREENEKLEREEKERLEREEKEKLEREEKEKLEREEKKKLEREEKARIENEKREALEREEKARIEKEEKERLEREENERVKQEDKVLKKQQKKEEKEKLKEERRLFKEEKKLLKKEKKEKKEHKKSESSEPNDDLKLLKKSLKKQLKKEPKPEYLDLDPESQRLIQEEQQRQESENQEKKKLKEKKEKFINEIKNKNLNQDDLRASITEIINNTLDKTKETLINKTLKRAMKLIDKKTKHVEEKTSNVIHPTHSCDGCQVRPIVGIRYNCTVCSNFDFCEKCEEQHGETHAHPMVKFRTSEFQPRIRCGTNNFMNRIETLFKNTFTHEDKFKKLVENMKSEYDLAGITDERILKAVTDANGDFEEAFIKLIYE
jgi:hypothetical protein